MTVAVVVKVFDGLVLATDSATTMQLPDGSAQVYNNADKIFHLHRGLPIGAMTWGLGSIGSASIATLSKDLRQRLMGDDPEHPEAALNPTEYSVEEVAGHARDMFYDLYATSFEATPGDELGYLVAGYSAGSKDSEAWLITLNDIEEEPDLVQVITADVSGYIPFAQPEATTRLFKGIDPGLAATLFQIVPSEQHEELKRAIAEHQRYPVPGPMPFPDAIEFARYLVEVTSGYSHFLLGPDTVGGKVEVAGLNRHEGFKWISRKHYYSVELNSQGARR
ncbi:hypothetical protein [Nocardia cyriacigeorgica]|uniref:hypothetical protein n=1 Tax=Nocardia cyriacigeorgica TaxID=135487 RepID=UPI001894A598|nr:hypothetical protein [Nocardia cyriacigeorgica]MBF6092364.1 hypothetical protein [Nocardia cyriacigeorgica]MBF6160407.1 hypothetical protein [Nocardia cyriacigeorgica]MBF6199492.1 hypothetical protein [Nocardia cyriacigeorgica]